jgi:hypothetical protein
MRVCISTTHYAPICEDGLALFKLGESMNDFRPESWVNSYSTAPNPHGIAVLGSRYFIIPGIAKGKLRIVDLETMKTSIVNAHTYALRAVALSGDEELLATASERGTMIRIWSSRDGAKVGEFRRGLDDADIFGLAFSPSGTFLASTSNKGTLHVYHLAFGAAGDGDEPHEHRRHASDAGSATPTAIPTANRPRSSSGLALSPPTQGRHSSRKPSWPSPDISPDMMTESVVLNDTPPARVKTARFQDPTPSAPSTRIRSHSHRQQTYPPLPSGGGGGGSPGSRHSEYPWPQQAVAYPTARDAAAAQPAAPAPSSANRTSKYGGLSHLPFVPAALRDVFSAASAEFHLPPVHAPTRYLASLPQPGGGGGGAPGDATPAPSSSSAAVASSVASSVRRLHPGSALAMPSAPQGSALPRAPRPRETLATGAPPRGLVAWCRAPPPPPPSRSSTAPVGGEHVARASLPGGGGGGQEEVCVVSVGPGGSGRFERFRVEPDGTGRVKLVFVGWKPFAEDEAA